jgi:hypothetical protein
MLILGALQFDTFGLTLIKSVVSLEVSVTLLCNEELGKCERYS